MKTLVVYYSRNNHTKKAGDKIAKILKAQKEEIKDKKDRSMIHTWFMNAFDEELRTSTNIEKTKYDPKDFDLTVIGTPIWDGITPAIRKYLSGKKFNKVAFFITFAASAEDAAFVMRKIIKRKPIAVLELQDREIMLKIDDEKIKSFCKKLK